MTTLTYSQLQELIPARTSEYKLYDWEKPGSRQLRVNSKGVTGSWIATGFPYEWIANGVPTSATGSTREDIIGTLLPRHGDQWDQVYFYCRCQDIEFREIGGGLGEATVNYTSEGFTSNMDIDMSLGAETHTVPSEAKWEVNSTGSNPYVAEQEIIDPYISYKVTYKTSYTYANAYTRYHYLNFAKKCAMCYKRVNNATWHTFPAGTLLLDNLTITPEFSQDIANYLLAITLQAEFKVNVPTTDTPTDDWTSTNEPRSQQKEWKPPVPLRTPDGNDYVWHNIPNQPYPFYLFFTTDAYKVGTKVFTDDVVVGEDASGNPTVSIVTPTPSHGGFYKPYMENGSNKIYKYGTCNFTTYLGIPDITGGA